MSEINQDWYCCLGLSDSLSCVGMTEIGKSHIDQFVADKVKALRKQHKLSLVKLGVLLDVSQAFLGQVESKKHRARYNIQHLNKLAQIFKCSPRDFLPEIPL